MEPAVHDDIRVNGHLDGHWSAWFGGLQGSCDDWAETTSPGRVADQAALHGLPAKVRDWASSCSRAPHRPELTAEMEQRDAAGTDPTARGGNAAAPAAQGRQATAAAPTAQPDRPAQPVRPTLAFLTTPPS